VNITQRTLCALSLLSVGSACQPPNHADGGGIDRVVVDDTSQPPMADVAIDRDASSTADCGTLTTDASINRAPMANQCCPDPQAHVDCFGGGSCRGAAVVANLYAPVYACTNERAQQWLRENVCEQLGSPIGTCPGSAVCQLTGATRLSDERYPMCDAPNPFDRYYPNRMGSGQLAAFWRLACSDRGPSVGSACTGDEHCRPAPATVRGQLRCVSGQCAEAPRPAREARFGESCAPSERPVGASPTCETCVTPGDGCGSFCSQRCLFDEDCPDAFVCAYAGRLCGGACVPAGHRAAFLGGPEPADAGAPSVAAPYPNCVDGGAPSDASMDAAAIDP
jgi:hypothetical protein